MFKKIITILSIFLYCITAVGQVKDTLKTVQPIDSISFEKISDSLLIHSNLDSIGFDKLSDSLKLPINLDSIRLKELSDRLKIYSKLDSTGVVQSLDSLNLIFKLDSVLQLKDSLLRPFYRVNYDTALSKTSYRARYRIAIDSNTNDTSYVSLPKPIDFITGEKKLTIVPIKPVNSGQPITNDLSNMAKDPVWWKNQNSIGLDISEAAFVNWNSGGHNSISAVLKLSVIRSYKKLHLFWRNEIFARYGLNAQEGRELRKTDDKIEYNSTFGYRKDTVSNWYYSAKLNFNTQFSKGYKYPETSNPVSKFFAPAYIFLGAGTQYDLKAKKFSLYMSPITLKSTFVLDEQLSEKGAFGVEKGAREKHEFGSLVQVNWQKNLHEKITMNNRLSLYTDYLNSFGNIDVKWDLGLKFTVTKYIKATIATYLIFDDDVKFFEDIDNDGTLESLGAKVQFKQLLGIGISYNF